MKNKILLYDLSGKNNVRFSPPCWNVKLCLINNNIDFDTIPIRFTEKNKISFSNQTLVPIIKYNEEVVFDSWKIFVWLNDKIKEIKLIPNESRLKEIKKDYKNMEEMFFKDFPKFSEIFLQLNNFENSLVKKK